MSIRAKENKLFKRWETKHKESHETEPRFFRDGVVNEQNFVKSRKRLLFLLKEVNGGDSREGNDDLRAFLADGAESGGRTWNDVARWAKGLQFYFDNKEIINLADIETINVNDRKELLSFIVAMNLDKTGGGSSSIWQEIEDATERDWAEIKTQMGFYQADIVICCGVFWHVCGRFLGEEANAKIKRTKRGIRYFWTQINSDSAKETVFIEYCHPAARIKKEFKTYPLLDTVAEIFPV